MSATPINPLHGDPAITTGRTAIQSGTLGQLLAVYAVIRARASQPDPIVSLGLPLIHELLAIAGEPAHHVTATRGTGPAGYEHWSLILTFTSGWQASLDIAAGLGRAQIDDLDLRIEWSGSHQVVMIEPARPSVTVINEFCASRLSAEVNPLADAIFAFSPAAAAISIAPPREWTAAAAVVRAARASAETDARVAIDLG